MLPLAPSYPKKVLPTDTCPPFAGTQVTLFLHLAVHRRRRLSSLHITNLSSLSPVSALPTSTLYISPAPSLQLHLSLAPLYINADTLAAISAFLLQTSTSHTHAFINSSRLHGTVARRPTLTDCGARQDDEIFLFQLAAPSPSVLPRVLTPRQGRSHRPSCTVLAVSDIGR